MAKYINGDVLYSKFLKLEEEALDQCLKYDANNKMFGVWSIIHGERVSYTHDIFDTPEEDVIPARHAYWVGSEFDGYADGNPVYYTWACSVCHEEVKSEGEPPDFIYCPYCGSRILEVSDENSSPLR